MASRRRGIRVARLDCHWSASRSEPRIRTTSDVGNKRRHPSGWPIYRRGASRWRSRTSDPFTTREKHTMTTISIIGAGNMATAIGARATAHGHTVEIMSRDASKAQAAADQIGDGSHRRRVRRTAHRRHRLPRRSVRRRCRRRPSLRRRAGGQDPHRDHQPVQRGCQWRRYDTGPLGHPADRRGRSRPTPR